MFIKSSLDKPTEAEVQYEIGYELKKCGFNVYFEREFDLHEINYTTKKNKKTPKIRVDVLVCDEENNIVCFIEVKDKNYKIGDDTRQINKYRHLSRLYQRPFFYCKGFESIKKVKENVISLI